MSRLLAVTGLLCAAALPCLGQSPPPAPTEWVTDGAAFLSVAARSSLNTELAAYQQRTGHQIVVWIGQSTGSVPIDEWAANAFQAWKVGRKGLDDGIALFIMARDHTARIEVGYGLEPSVTDAASSELLRNILFPGIQKGDRDGAVRDTVQKLETLAAGESSQAGNAPASRRPPSTGQLPGWQLALIVLGILLFLIFAIRHPVAAWYIASILIRRGGGSTGGGGFQGGGGRSGGGGASGRW